MDHLSRIVVASRRSYDTNEMLDYGTKGCSIVLFESFSLIAFAELSHCDTDEIPPRSIILDIFLWLMRVRLL